MSADGSETNLFNFELLLMGRWELLIVNRFFYFSHRHTQTFLSFDLKERKLSFTS